MRNRMAPQKKTGRVKAMNGEGKEDKPVGKMTKDQAAKIDEQSVAPPSHSFDGDVPMEEDSVKKEKKRGREVAAEKGEKTPKTAKIETVVVTEVEKSRDAVKFEEGLGALTSVEVSTTTEVAFTAEVKVAGDATTGEDDAGKTKRMKKRKIAMIVAYCGAGYQGMQRNPGAITIEGELEQALFKAGAISEDNFGVPRKVDWMRAARTDKGVSAIGQVVSGQFIIEPEGFVDRVNTFLPKDIIVLGYKRVIASFNAKKLCDKRRYEYILPTYAFDPSKHLDREATNAIKDDESEKPGVVAAEKGTKPVDLEAVPPTEVEQESDYVFDETEMNRLNRILSRYKGTHNYHNFTARTQAEDPSAHRFIISFEADDIFTVDGVDYVRCHVIGQSFMLHQIRKMIGLAVAIMRGAAPESIMDFALRKDTKLNVPMAPELGLFLEECYYSSYNKKFQASHEELSLKDFADKVNEFKKNVIYPHIASTEARDKVFALWLHSINDRHYPDFVAAREGTYKPGNRIAEAKI